MDKNDSFSNNICRICWSKVDSFHQFYIEVKLTHDNLNSTISANTIDVKSEFSGEVEVNDFLNTEEPTLSDDEEASQHSSTSPEPVVIHKKRGRKKKSITTVSAVEIQETESTKQEEANKRNEEDQRIREFYNLKCDLCSNKSDTFIEVRAHYRIEHKQRRGYLSCCNRKFFYRGEILEHMHWHLNPEAFK